MKIKLCNLILIILIILFFVVCSIIYNDYKKMCDTIQTYDDIEEQCVSVLAKSKDKKIDWDKLYKINSDIVAWVYIPNTQIDYPVVKSKEYDYYLSHDIHKQHSKYGSIFIDHRLYSKPFESKNLIIYGHNMGRWTDVMFGTLMEYKDKEYFNKHKYIYLYTKEQDVKYQIVSIREVSDASDAYNIDFSQREFKRWINNVITKSIYPIDYENVRIKNTLTLSTCTYGYSRLVLHCIPIEKL